MPLSLVLGKYYFSFDFVGLSCCGLRTLLTCNKISFTSLQKGVNWSAALATPSGKRKSGNVSP